MSVSTPAITQTMAARPAPRNGQRNSYSSPSGRYNLSHRMVMAPLTRSRAR